MSTPRRLDPKVVRVAKSTIKRLALRRGLLVRKLPAGRQGDAFEDQRWLLRDQEVRTIFDVGAYVGETAVRYRRLFPAAQIHCFEPVPASFHELEKTLGSDANVVLNRLAVGATTEPVELHVNRSAATSSTLRPARDVSSYLSAEYFTEVVSHQVESTTIDDYCATHGVDQIGVLKLDIQGAELAALMGARNMLSRRAISLVYTELLIAPMYEGQAGIGKVLAICEEHGYRLYGFYNFEYGEDTRLFQVDGIVLAPR